MKLTSVRYATYQRYRHDGEKHVLRHKHCLPCKHASYGYKCQEHDGLKVKREGKLRESKKIKGVYSFVSTKDSTSDCNLW